MRGMKSLKGMPLLPPRPREHEVTCTCGEPMRLKASAYGWFYGCSAWPECGQKVGAHTDGRPLGRPGTAAERAARIEAHAVFDMLWKYARMTPTKIRSMPRKAAYAWMQKRLNLSEEQAHIGNFDVAQCEKLIAAALEVLLDERLYEK